MKPTTRVLGSLVCFAIVSCAKVATAAPIVLDTAYHPTASHMTLDFFLGDSNDPFAQPLGASIGPLAVSGTMTVDIQLAGAGNGSLTWLTSSLVLESTSGTLDLGTLGTIDYAINAFGFSFATEPKPVVSYGFGFPFDETTTLVLNQGTVAAFNPTGLLAALPGDVFPLIDDFDQFPLTAVPSFNVVEPFSGQVDDGPGLSSPQAEVQMLIPSFATPLVPLGEDAAVWLRLSGEIHTAAVPEPSTLALGILGGILLAARPVRGLMRSSRVVRRPEVAVDLNRRLRR